MATKTASSSRSLARSMAMGILLSMAITYGAHVFGTWKMENYRPDPETTSSLLLYNKCALFGDTHTLRPATGISSLSDGIDGTKLAGSFMSFSDGHVAAMVILSVVLGGIIFFIRKMLSKKSLS